MPLFIASPAGLKTVAMASSLTATEYDGRNTALGSKVVSAQTLTLTRIEIEMIMIMIDFNIIVQSQVV